MSLPPVEKSISVPLPPDRAFVLFTEKLGTWWPTQSHSVSAASGEVSRSVIVEPRVGGTIVEIAHNGTPHEWGRFVVWEPGVRVAFTWHPGREAKDATQVEVTFAPDGARTKVLLIHTGWEVLGSDADSIRGNYNAGWVPVLQQFAEAA